MEISPQENGWKEKIKKLLGLCQKEIKRTKEIGSQMLIASKINGELNQNYQKLGIFVHEKIKQNSLDLGSPDLVQFIESIDSLKEKLSRHEEELKRIKHSQEI